LPLPHSLSAEPASEVRWFAPSSSSLRLCRRSPLRFPLASDAFDAAGFRRVLSFPSGSCFLLPRLRYEPQVAPRSVPPALPVIDRRVASILSPSAVPVVKAPGCPFALHPRYRRRSGSGLPQNPHPPVPADFRSESPRSSVPSGHPFRISGLLRRLALGFVAQTFPKSPWFFACSTSPIPSVPSCPETSFLG
jgi:hypothetical protein